MKVAAVAYFAVLFACFWAQRSAEAQGTFNTSTVVSTNIAVLRTGIGTPLVSTNYLLDISTNLNEVLTFEVGFSTDETPASGTFLDSFTATLQTADGQHTALYFTADATGVQWAPETPGAIPLESSSILREPIPFPSLEPVHADQRAFFVTAPIPEQFRGTSAILYFDLFDNFNSLHSLAWVNNIVVVPEPHSFIYLLIGMMFLLPFRRRR